MQTQTQTHNNHPNNPLQNHIKMGLQTLLTTTFSIVALFLYLYPITVASFATTSGSISTWCSQTPYPNQCEHYLDHQKSSSGSGSGSFISGQPDFLKLVLGSALQASLDAHRSASMLGVKCRNAKEKAAWSDCLELYELATDQLNQIMSDPTSTHDDSQTWLSAVLTHIETCKSGFEDVGANGDLLLPLMGYPNISYLISNALAVNNKRDQTQTKTLDGFKSGFPRWVKGGDRRLLQSSSSSTSADIVVAQDGSGHYETVGEALVAANAMAKKSKGGRTVIYVKAGEYKENLVITSKNVMMTGDGIGKTIIAGSKSVGGGATTFRSATVAITDKGSNFMAKGITFRNTAGAGNHQAVALRSGSDFSVFYQCGFEGYQDTLYVYTNRQFYRDCDIYGTVDFIFGNAAVVFQSCNIYPRRPPNFHNTITAQGRTDPNQNTGISIHGCTVKAAESLGSAQTFLGRPWQKYSRTVFMNTFLDGIINSAGWTEWSGSFALDTLYYAEYANTGPGAKTSGRVNWKGFHVLTSAADAVKFTVGNFIAGDGWLPATGVPFDSGLST